MLDKEFYTNGQRVYDLIDGVLTYYYKDGVVKAKGNYRNDKMEDEWVFYRATGQLWQTGSFKDHKQQGRWIRYNRKDEIEFDEVFQVGKKVKK